jgi:ribosomal protein L37AE/L43A
MPVLSEKVREGYGLGYAVEFLTRRLDDLARLPECVEVWQWRQEQFTLLDGPQTLLLVVALHRRSRRVCGMDPRTIAIPGMCPDCGVPALLRHDDDPDRIWCSVCNKTLTEAGYLKAQRMQFAPVTPATDPR